MAHTSLQSNSGSAWRRWTGALTATCALLLASAQATPPSSVDLHKYICIARYDLPEPTRTTAPEHSILAQEASSVTYNWDTDTLFIVGDGGTSMVQVTKTGQLINSMTLAPGSSPNGTEFYDTEGVTYVGNGKFVFLEERDRLVNLCTYVPDTVLKRTDVKTVKLGTPIGNIGIEGICFDPQSGGFIVVKEKDPISIFQTTIDFDAGTASNGSPTTVASTNLFDPALASLADFSDIFCLANVPSLAGTPDASHLLIISQESGQIINVDRNGNVFSRLTILAPPTSLLTVPDMTMEGVTMDRDGIIYVVNENGGGDANHPQLWVYAPTDAPNTAPTAIAISSALTQIPENTITTVPIRLGNISLTDDGLGANNLTISGADAGDFQIIGASLYLRAGTSLNIATKSLYHITVNVDDPALGGSPDAFVDYTLTITPAPVATANLIISEVAAWSSGSSLPSLLVDWFEVTNIGTATADISGWRVDDSGPSFDTALVLNGVTLIAPGESVIFMETNDLPAKKAAFLDIWFGAHPPANLQIGNYTGASIGLSTGGDAVNLYDSDGVLQAHVDFGTSPGNVPFGTFDNSIGLNNATITTLSSVGFNGAFFAATDPKELGSPGTIGVTATPIVVVTALDADAAETGQATGTFRFIRSGGSVGALTINYTVATGAGQAIAADYTPALTGSVTIPLGQNFVDVVITPVDDAFFEGSETVTVTIFDSGNYDVGALDTATITIADNEGNLPPSAIVLNNAVNAISEGASTGVAVKLADIAVTDDQNGNNVLSISGPDVAFFQIMGSALYLKAGTALSSITKPSYSITVNVDDSTVGVTPDASVPFTLTVVPFVAPGSIIISEVHPNGSAATYGADWFEVTNTGTKDVNLAGWKVDDGSNDLAAALALRGVTVIPAKKSAIFYESNAAGTNVDSILANFSTAWFGTATPPAGFLIGTYGGSGIGLSGSGDSVVLFDATGNRLTGVSWTAAATNATLDNKAGLGSTAAPFPVLSTNSVAGTNFAFVSANGLETGSPGTVPIPTPGKIVITEIHPNGSSASYGADWFELTNVGGTDMNITDWKVDDSSNDPAVAGALRGVSVIPAGKSAVFYESNAAGTNVDSIKANFSTAWFGSPTLPSGFLIGTYSATGIGLSGGGDSVVIFDANGNRVTGVNFGTAAITSTFENKTALGTNAAPFPNVTNISVALRNGAFVSANGIETGSPGIFVPATPARLIVSEVHPNGSSASYGADWFELTNVGGTDATITGYKVDDSSNDFAVGGLLTGVTTIPAGKSAVFYESNAAGTNIDSIKAAFSTAWFGSATPPAGFLLGTYTATGIGLSGGGDGVFIFDADGKRVTGLSFGTASVTASFDNKAGLGTTVAPYPTIATVSVAGVNGAFVSANGIETGSPGTINSVPTLTLPASPLIVAATSLSGANVTFSVSAIDVEDGVLIPKATPASGSLFALGNTTVNVTVTDPDGATRTGSFVVQVVPVLRHPSEGQPVSSLAGPLDLSTGVVPPGGIFSGSGVTAAGIFDPGKVGPGLYTITYTVNGASSTITIRVAAPPVITPAAVPTSVLGFNGSSRYVDAGAGIALANNSFTVEFWAKRGVAGGDHIIVNQGLAAAGTDKALFIGFRSTNVFSFGFFNDNLDTVATYTDVNWHHWACTYDAGTRERRIYRDGAQVATDVAAGNFTGSGNFIIGANYGGTSQFFNGSLSEVRVWSTARNGSQVAAKMFDSPVGNEAGLVAFWPLDDGIGAIAADLAVGHANSGTIFGGAGWQTMATSFGALFFEINTPFVDPGATAVDSTNAALTVTATNDVVANTAGFYGIVYSATDAATGITGTARRLVIVGDRTAPSAPEILSPANGSTVSGATTVISGNAEAASAVTLTITGPVNQTVTVTASGAGKFQSAPLSLPDGAYSVTAVAKDAAGNVSASLPATAFTHGTLPVVQAGISVTRGGLTQDRGTGLFLQTVTLKNTTSGAIAGPVYLVLDGLSATATLSGATGVTAQLAPLNSPYVKAVPSGSLAAGASVSVTLKFVNPSKGAVNYTTRTVAGGNVAP